MEGNLCFLMLLGQRATVINRHSPTNRVFFMAYQHSMLPPPIMAMQILKWFTNFKWPRPLNSASLDVNEALSDFLRVFRYKQASTKERSLLISKVFSRVLTHCPHLKSLAGRSHYMDAFSAFRPMLLVFSILANPLFEDWLVLDKAIEPAAQLIRDVNPGEVGLG